MFCQVKLMVKLTLSPWTGLCVAVLHSVRFAKRSAYFICILIVIQIHAQHPALPSAGSTATSTLRDMTTHRVLILISFIQLFISFGFFLCSPGWSHWYSIWKLAGKQVSDRMWCHVGVWGHCSGAQECAALCPQCNRPLESAVPCHTWLNTGGNNGNIG